MSFKISDTLTLPRESITWVNAFLAKRGGGKTYSASVLAEEMLKKNVPIVVIDGMGIWYGLRVGANGKGDGLPIVVFGGEHGDLPLNPQKIKEVARAVVETNISAVLDLSPLSKAVARKIVQEFLDELYKLNRVERHVFIEEADLWAPQRVIGIEQAGCLGAMDNFVRRGGNHNLGCSLITQRSAVLNKDLLTQSDTLIILRTLAPQDKKAIQSWVEEQTDSERKELKEWYDTLNSLKNGEAWVWHPENPKIFKKIMFRKRETFHATRLFLLNERSQKIKLMDISEFIERFKERFEPKPKEIPKEIPKQVQVPKAVPMPVIIQTFESVKTPAKIQPIETSIEIETPFGAEPKEIVVRKTEPTIILEKFKPTIEVFSEPSTPLGRLIVILSNKFGNRNDKWSIKNIKAMIEKHGWATDGIDHEIERLTQWEILVFQPKGALRFFPERVRVVEKNVEMNEYS